MRKDLRLIMRMFLTSLLVVVLLGISTAAASPTVATIGRKKYTSLEAAVQAVKKGQTIKLAKNIRMDDYFNLYLDKKVAYTIDLNKKKIIFKESKSNPYQVCINKGKVTIKNGTIIGKIRVDKGAILKIVSGNCRGLENYGTITIANATIQNKNMTTDVIENSGKLTIKKAKITSYGGYLIRNKEGAKFTIKNGTYKKAVDDSSALIWNSGVVNISGGKFYGRHSVHEPCMITNIEKGKVTISGGVFINPSYNETSYEPTDGAGYISNNGKLTIKGGRFTSTKNARAIFSNGEVLIQGGIIESTAPAPVTEYEENWPAVVTITGGSLKITGGTIRHANGKVLDVWSNATANVEKATLEGACIGWPNE